VSTPQQREDERGRMQREIARLTWVVRQVRDDAAEWRKFAHTLPEDQAVWMNECAMNVEDALEVSARDAYQAHPQRMIAMHLEAAATLAGELAAEAER
jgi:hypothetical protein